MRIVRTALIIVFILSLGTFGISELLEMQNQDTTLPEITSDREVLEISCDYTEEDLLAGLSAYDETDGDLTSQIIPGSFSRFIEDGVCNLTYVVFDSSDQPASLTRRVQLPIITRQDLPCLSPLFCRTGRQLYRGYEPAGSRGYAGRRPGRLDCSDRYRR